MISYRTSFIFATEIKPGDAVKDKKYGNIYLYLPLDAESEKHFYLYPLKIVSKTHLVHLNPDPFAGGIRYIISQEKYVKELFVKSSYEAPKPTVKIGDKFKEGYIGAMWFDNKGEFCYRVDFGKFNEDSYNYKWLTEKEISKSIADKFYTTAFLLDVVKIKLGYIVKDKDGRIFIVAFKQNGKYYLAPTNRFSDGKFYTHQEVVNNFKIILKLTPKFPIGYEFTFKGDETYIFGYSSMQGDDIRYAIRYKFKEYPHPGNWENLLLEEDVLGENHG